MTLHQTAPNGRPLADSPRIGPVRPTQRADSEFDQLIASIATWYVEFRAGRRSLGQLHGLVTPTLRRRLARRAGQRGPAPQLRPVVRTLLQADRGDVVEAVALVRTGARTTALAITFVHDGVRWWCSELTAPEDGELPTATGSGAPRTARDDWPVVATQRPVPTRRTGREGQAD